VYQLYRHLGADRPGEGGGEESLLLAVITTEMTRVTELQSWSWQAARNVLLGSKEHKRFLDHNNQFSSYISLNLARHRRLHEHGAGDW